MQTIHKIYRVEKSRIGFLKFIFEAHDGLAVITTLNAGGGMVRFAIAPDCLEEVNAVVGDLQKEIFIHEV